VPVTDLVHLVVRAPATGAQGLPPLQQFINQLRQLNPNEINTDATTAAAQFGIQNLNAETTIGQLLAAARNLQQQQELLGLEIE
jgi:hypothetical protein